MIVIGCFVNQMILQNLVGIWWIYGTYSALKVTWLFSDGKRYEKSKQSWLLRLITRHTPPYVHKIVVLKLSTIVNLCCNSILKFHL
jgi:uncharacterized protein (DUF2225 family)